MQLGMALSFPGCPAALTQNVSRAHQRQDTALRIGFTKIMKNSESGGKERKRNRLFCSVGVESGKMLKICLELKWWLQARNISNRLSHKWILKEKQIIMLIIFSLTHFSKFFTFFLLVIIKVKSEKLLHLVEIWEVPEYCKVEERQS